MQSTRQITIEHSVLASNQPYEKVLEALESRLGSEEGWRKTEQRIQALAAAQAPWEQAAETNAPLHFVVYEDEAGKTFVAYDNFVSLLAQYQREEITQVAQIVEQKLEALLAAVTR
jgi:hypothetical protein